MVGHGQEVRPPARRRRAAGPTKKWIEMGGDSASCPRWIAGHDVCLGIFGTGPKALRVVPNKVFQGAAGRRAIVICDTARSGAPLGDGAIYVPPGDAGGAGRGAAPARRGPQAELAAARKRAHHAVLERFGCAAVVELLVARCSARLNPPGGDRTTAGSEDSPLQASGRYPALLKSTRPPFLRAPSRTRLERRHPREPGSHSAGAGWRATWGTRGARTRSHGPRGRAGRTGRRPAPAAAAAARPPCSRRWPSSLFAAWGIPAAR